MGPQIVGKGRRDKPQADARSGNARRRGPRPATPERLKKAALAYLERYAAPAAQVRRVLLRRVKRSAELHGTDPEAGAGAVDALVARLVAEGLIDDRAYAESKARGLSRRGASARRIAAQLAAKGVAGEDRALALAGIAAQPGEPEL
ncbi:MAG: RecX family transcriptional regulator, partial [Kiloniellales bacterium]